MNRISKVSLLTMMACTNLFADEISPTGMVALAPKDMKISGNPKTLPPGAHDLVLVGNPSSNGCIQLD